MFRIDNGKDIEDDEFNKYWEPFNNELDRYVQNITAPDICAFAIAKGYELDTLYIDNFENQLTYGTILFNDNIKVNKKFKNTVKTILKEKYNLTVTNENPLELKEANND